MKNRMTGWLIAFVLMAFTGIEAQDAFESDGLCLKIDDNGQVVSLLAGNKRSEVLCSTQPAPVMQVRVDKKWSAPESASMEDDVVKLSFPGGITACVQIRKNPSHLTLELIDLEPIDSVEAMEWGPYPTTLGETVGEIVGVARGQGLAFGIQALNVKTVGGKMTNEEGSITSRGSAALPTEFGATLQAFALDRSKPRKIHVWGDWGDHFPEMPVPPIEGETVIGSKIALFGCSEPDALSHIGAIEIAEGLPHPMIDGEWIKESAQTGRSYLIAGFSESNADLLLDAAERAGLMSLYHDGPFATWGHFKLREDCFPNGIEGVKRIVEKAKNRGIRIGAHTLTNFTTTNDPYVTPVPHPKLALTGSSTLIEAIGPDATEIPVASPQYFANEKANWVHAVRMGDEIAVYRSVTKEAPYRLLDCKRGAFGTTATAHEKGATIGKLLDHGYKVFFPNYELQRELVKNMADFFNATGVSHMDFDGHEGCLASGQGNMAVDLFALDFFNLTDHEVVNGSSRSSHFYWHINHYLNWGEPWYEGFRESMQEYRINNQALLERNYMPNMLGWYLLTATTSLADMEWMLARAAGYDAGFALATQIDAFDKNPEVGEILDAIREWEAARHQGVFTAAQRKRLKDPANEFHLEKTARGWTLYPFHVAGPFEHEQRTLAPGMPTASEWEWTQKADEQPLRFIIRTAGDSGALSDLRIEIDHVHEISLPIRLEAGQSLACDGKQQVRVYDTKGRQKQLLDLGNALPKLGPGKHKASFDCAFQGSPGPKVKVSFQAMGKGEALDQDPIRCLDAHEARAMLAQDPWFTMLEMREMRALTQQEFDESLTLEQCREETRGRFIAAILPFTEAEAVATKGLAGMVTDTLSDAYPKFAEVPWRFIKTANHICGGFVYTRGDCIFFSARMIDLFVQMWDLRDRPGALDDFLTLLAHEQMHVVQRVYPDAFAKLYKDVWGFVEGTVPGHPWISERQVTNPDAVHSNWLAPNPNPSNGPAYYWMRTLLKDVDEFPVLGRDFIALAFHVEKKGSEYSLVLDDAGAPVHTPMEECEAYMARFPAVYKGQDHPNEIAAYTFEILMRTDFLGIKEDRKPENYESKVLPALDELRAWCEETFKN